MGSNTALLLQDDLGLFIRHGTGKYRPGNYATGLKKGQTVRAWPSGGNLLIEGPAGRQTWSRG
jgi:hypothetical protein